MAPPVYKRDSSNAGASQESYIKALLDQPHLEPQEAVDLTHPFTITPGKVIIHSHHLQVEWAGQGGALHETDIQAGMS